MYLSIHKRNDLKLFKRKVKLQNLTLKIKILQSNLKHNFHITMDLGQLKNELLL